MYLMMASKIQLILGSVKGAHEVEHSLLNLVGTAVEFVHFVDDDDGLELHLQGFLQNETCLRHRSLEGINEQEDAVGHVEHTFHFTSEIGVPRSVDDVDFDAFVVDAHVFGEDSDAALTLQVVIVKD